ncbi:hypothetical protein D9M71_574670 [compost metagenome]
MGAVHHPLVEGQVMDDVVVDVLVAGARGGGFQGQAQGRQVFLGAAQGGQARGLDLDHPARFQGLLHRTAGQRLHGGQRVGAGAHIGAVALAHFQHAGKGQHPHGFAHGVAADADELRQFGFRWQALAKGPGAVVDALADLLQGDIHQGALEGSGGHGKHPIIR